MCSLMKLTEETIWANKKNKPNETYLFVFLAFLIWDSWSEKQ